MAILTNSEFKTTTLGCVDDVIYHNIERKFRKILGDKAPEFLRKYYGWTIQRLSAQSMVDIMDCFVLI